MKARLAPANEKRTFMKPKRGRARIFALTGEPGSHRYASARGRSIEEFFRRAMQRGRARAALYLHHRPLNTSSFDNAQQRSADGGRFLDAV
jgi:hypothetical protein